MTIQIQVENSTSSASLACMLLAAAFVAARVCLGCAASGGLTRALLGSVTSGKLPIPTQLC